MLHSRNSGSRSAWNWFRMARLWIFAALLVLAGCGSSEPSKPLYIDPSKEPGYAETVSTLRQLNQEASAHLEAGRRDEAAALVKDGLPLSKDLLRSSRPPLDAMEAISDLDHIYAMLLLGNRHYVYARQLFQQNLARWRSWQPQTEETRRRRALAEEGMARCDELLKQENLRNP